MDPRVRRKMERTARVSVRRKGCNHDWGMCGQRATQQSQNEGQSTKKVVFSRTLLRTRVDVNFFGTGGDVRGSSREPR